MDNPIHKGSFPPFEHGDKVTFTPRIGYTVESSATVLASQYEAFVADKTAHGFACEAVPRIGTPYYEVSWVPRDDSAAVITVWELAGNEMEQSIWLLPKVQVEFLKLSTATSSSEPFYEQQAFLQRVVNGKVAGEASVPAWKKDAAGNVDMVPIHTPDEFEAAIQFVSLQIGSDPDFLDVEIFQGLAASLARGVESFPISHYVVRRTRQLSANTNILLEVASANFIYTRTEFTTLESPPATLKFSLPLGFYQRKTPSMTQQRDGTWLVNEEWWHATAFDPFIYESFKPVAPGS